MDMIGEGNKSFGHRVEDLMEAERRKDEEGKETIVYQPKDVGVIDTSAFIKTKMQFGLDHVFRLSDSVLPGEQMPPFLCPGLVGDEARLVDSEEFLGKYLLLFFYSKDFGPEGAACLDLMADLAAAPELELELVAISTDSVEVHRAWRERREGGGPAIMLGDRTGQMARSFGVLDKSTHLAYSALFLVDLEGVVQVL